MDQDQEVLLYSENEGDFGGVWYTPNTVKLMRFSKYYKNGKAQDRGLCRSSTGNSRGVGIFIDHTIR